MQKAVKDVDTYIALASKPAQVMMKQIRAAIRSAAPQATEMISYAIPFYQYKSLGFKGRMIYFAAYPSHVGVYVVPRNIPPALAKQVAKFKAGKSTLQFPIGTKIPVTMIKQLVKLRMKEIDESLKVKGKKV